MPIILQVILYHRSVLGALDTKPQLSSPHLTRSISFLTSTGWPDEVLLSVTNTESPSDPVLDFLAGPGHDNLHDAVLWGSRKGRPCGPGGTMGLYCMSSFAIVDCWLPMWW